MSILKKWYDLVWNSQDGSVHYTTEIKAESVQFLGDSKSRSDGSGSNDTDIPF